MKRLRTLFILSLFFSVSWSYVQAQTYFSLPNINITGGQTAIVGVSTPSAQGVLGVDLWISYDPNVVTPVSAATASGIDGVLESNFSDPGIAKIALAFSGSTNLTGNIIEVSFTAIGSPYFVTCIGK